MVIQVRGNGESFQLYRKIKYTKIKLSGTFSYREPAPVNLLYDDRMIQFPNVTEFYSFTEQIKGASKEKIILICQEHKINPDFINQLRTKGEIEIGLFKSIFLIYNWIEIGITDAYAINLADKIYDEFLIDYSGLPEVQKDIYFISSKYEATEYLKRLDKLIDLNLLVSVEFETIVGNYKSYFIPLVKPGVSRENFKSDFDISGTFTYNLWKRILNERDSKIRNWITSSRY